MIPRSVGLRSQAARFLVSFSCSLLTAFLCASMGLGTFRPEGAPSFVWTWQGAVAGCSGAAAGAVTGLGLFLWVHDNDSLLIGLITGIMAAMAGFEEGSIGRAMLACLCFALGGIFFYLLRWVGLKLRRI